MNASFKHGVLLCIVLTACWFQLGAQSTATPSPAVQVTPEAYVVPSTVTLRFRVSANGVANSQTERVTASAKAAPGQRIRLTGRLSDVSAVVRWSGASLAATAGARAAACTSGTFRNEAAQDLVAGWQQPGTLTCTLTFSLAEPQKLAPGSYTRRLEFTLETE